MRKNLLLILGAVVFFSGCGLNLPPITKEQTDTHFPGHFVWVDLITNDVPAVKKFYGDLFAWEFEGSESGYTVITHHGSLIGGILYSGRLKEDISESRWIAYLSVPDVAQAVETVRRNGGTVVREPFDLDDRGRAALIQDAQGAILVLLNSVSGDPEFIKPRFGQWLWIELVTNAADSAVGFYTKLTGHSADTRVNENGYKYHFLKDGSKNIGGIVQSPWDYVKPNWLPYIRVEDPAVVVDRVKKIGGQVVMEPNQNIRKGSVAIIADPSGAVMAVQKWPLN